MHALPIWSPKEKVLIKRLESAYNIFSSYAVYRIGEPMQNINHNYTDTSEWLMISTVESARERADLIFFLGLMVVGIGVKHTVIGHLSVIELIEVLLSAKKH